MLKKTFGHSLIGHYFHPRVCLLVSHLLYTDNMLLFVNGEQRTLRKFFRILTTYEECSNQVINKEESALFMSNQISNIRRRELICLIEFREGQFSVTYFRAPLSLGCMTSRMLEPLVKKKIRNKVVSWKWRLLLQEVTSF